MGDVVSDLDSADLDLAADRLRLGPHFHEFVREQVESGRYRDAGEVVRAGLRLLEDQEAEAGVAALRHAIDAAFDDPRPSIPANEVFAELRARRGQPVDGG